MLFSLRAAVEAPRDWSISPGRGDPDSVAAPTTEALSVCWVDAAGETAALVRLGAVVIEHNPLYTGAELKHLFADHRATVAVAWDKLGERLGDLPAELRFDRVVSVDGTREMPLRTRASLRLVPIAEGGEDVTAAIVLAPGATFDEEALRSHCRETLAAYKVPRRIVVVDELPKNLIGRTLRRTVRESLLPK
ncbi:hypothetical protein AX769_09585 [Frondihabitans sp. PAMC 28766]|uniref:AMP-binding enzyme n=1 Tax=Frondihabitans sp. PAMC 28766 TaxID=1795630 RepID=UPI00078BA0C0|nr:hypothetical protein AX769_09585 [Frondihabitans sp. PAMC 28766]